MSVLIRGPLPPVEVLEKYLAQIKNGKIKGWIFVKRLDAITQRTDGEPVRIPGIEVIGEGITNLDLKYVAKKIMERAQDYDDIQEQYDTGFLE